MEKLKFNLRRTQITIAIITMLVGFLLVTQWRGQQAISHQLKAQTEQDLGQIIKQLNLENETLRTEVETLQSKAQGYRRQAANQKVIFNQAQENLKNLKIAIGFLEIKGPGIRVWLTDKENRLETFDFLELIHELKVAGAEGIAIDNIRITARTSFKKKKETIYLNGNKLISPYEIKAIGNPSILYQGVNLAGGIKDKLNSLEGVTLKATKAKNLIIPSR